jgi:hypothetical protein
MSGPPAEHEAVDDEWADAPFTAGRAAGGRAPLLLRPRGARRARTHPWIIAGLWMWQTALALGVAIPAATLVARVYGTHPRGDAPLWDPGGLALLDFLSREGRALSPVAAIAEMTLVVGAVGGLVPAAAAMMAIARVPRHRASTTLSQTLSAAFWAMPAFSFLLVVFGVTQALTLVVGYGATQLVEAWTSQGLGAVRAARLGIATGIVFVLLASGLGVVHDLARAAVVCARARGARAIVLGVRSFGAAPLPLWWSWAWRWIAAAVPVAAVASLAGSVGGRGGAALALIAMLHQGVVLARVSLHTSWLARALRAIDGWPPN